MNNFKHSITIRVPIGFKCITLSLFFLMLLLSNTSIQAKSRKNDTLYSFDIKNEYLTKILERIEQSTDYIFFYYDEDLKGAKNSLQTKDLTISETLDKLFTNIDSSYKIDGNQIFIRRAEKRQTKEIQQYSKVRITGRILDEFSDPIAGAGILEKGTSNGVLSDIDGKFTLSVSANSTLIISYIGYMSQTIVAKEDQHYEIQLKEDPKVIEEVVVIGYGTQRRSLVTSAISKMTVNESNRRQVASPSQLLDGRIAGVTTSTTSGNLGTGTHEYSWYGLH